MTVNDTIEHASLTDVGVRRSHNQDSHAVLLASDELEGGALQQDTTVWLTEAGPQHSVG